MDAVKALRALGEPTRYQIFSYLLEGRHCVRSLSKKLGITESAVSQHLKIMREAGLVYGEQCGYFTHYIPQPEAIEFLCETFTDMLGRLHDADKSAKACRCHDREGEDR